MLTLATSKFQRMCAGHAFREWRDLYREAKYIKRATGIIFEKSVNSGRLTVPSVKIFFQSVAGGGDVDILDSEDGFERVRMERIIMGVRRQILMILFKEWSERARASKNRRSGASEKLQVRVFFLLLFFR